MLMYVVANEMKCIFDLKLPNYEPGPTLLQHPDKETC